MEHVDINNTFVYTWSCDGTLGPDVSTMSVDQWKIDRDKFTTGVIIDNPYKIKYVEKQDDIVYFTIQRHDDPLESIYYMYISRSWGDQWTN